MEFNCDCIIDKNKKCIPLCKEAITALRLSGEEIPDGYKVYKGTVERVYDSSAFTVGDDETTGVDLCLDLTINRTSDMTVLTTFWVRNMPDLYELTDKNIIILTKDDEVAVLYVDGLEYFNYYNTDPMIEDWLSLAIPLEEHKENYSTGYTFGFRSVAPWRTEAYFKRYDAYIDEYNKSEPSDEDKYIWSTKNKAYIKASMYDEEIHGKYDRYDIKWGKDLDKIEYVEFRPKNSFNNNESDSEDWDDDSEDADWDALDSERTTEGNKLHSADMAALFRSLMK